MKQLLIPLLALFALAGCTKNIKVIDPMEPDYNAPIILSAGVEANSEPATKAPIEEDYFPVSTNNIFRITAYSGANAPTNTTPTYFNNIQVDSKVSTLELATTQYYPANGDKVYFYAYAPEATSLTAGTASDAPTANYTIDGTMDIMAAQVTSGIAKATSQPSFHFTHKLQQLIFNVVRDNTYPADKTVTSIVVNNVRTSAKLNIFTGDLTFDGEATNTLNVGTLNVTIPLTTPVPAGEPIMMEATGVTSLSLTITADGVIYNNVSVQVDGEAATNYEITLTFRRQGIVPTASITTWSDAADPIDKDVI